MDNPQTAPNLAKQEYGVCPNDYQESAWKT